MEADPAPRGRVATRGASRADLPAAVVLAPLAVLNRVTDAPWWLLAGAALAVLLIVASSRRYPRTTVLMACALAVWSPGAGLIAALLGFRAGQRGVRAFLQVAAAGVLLTAAGLALSWTEPSVACSVHRSSASAGQCRESGAGVIRQMTS